MMEDKIEVGEFVRTDKGMIAKVKEIRLGKHSITDEIINMYIMDNKNWTTDKYIVNHSKNIIDLIEVGDYVNGKLIHKVDIRKDSAYVYYGNCKTFTNYQIESILTKEQYEANVYKLEE